jgi:hypothetical protein
MQKTIKQAQTALFDGKTMFILLIYIDWVSKTARGTHLRICKLGVISH